ncbi:trypsin-like serine protease [Kutzneria viridogrisea]|uniref:Trypsin-like serine protease n=2 Tax=Kutzneria TaxID=43356 RepID=W5W6B1_9PSEU|nr:trypsin-like serine protease [Kutzneria albida]AHH96733.1 trypsin-like serine protease [Kutzneria albida DSM 43870]MBA8928048.1 secreted trypsin-like serine protease [Kutzneria viridogrisea]
MRKTALAAALVGVALTGITTAQAVAAPTIIGGTEVSSAPWGAQIYWNTGGSEFDGFECSGTIIAAQWVMTAHHCQSSGGMHVKIGDVRFDQGTEVAVDKQYTSPNGDIALLHLSKAVTTTYMKLGSGDPSRGATNQIYGWGRTQGQSPPASVLRTANVRVTGSSTDAYGGRAIASTGINGAAWHGDSGGPEVSNGVQVGVASTAGNSGSNPQGSQNYASVAASRSWIRQTSGV